MKQDIQNIVEGNKCNAVVYKILNNANGKCYIGSSVKFERRKKRHFEDLKYGKHHCRPLQRAYDKYGSGSFSIIILEEFDYKVVSDILAKEQYYIDTIKPQYNVCVTAGSQLGSKRSAEFKQKCSDRLRGRPTWNKGKHTMTNEQKTKMGIGRKNGKKREITSELRIKLSKAHKGKILSRSHKISLSKAKLRGTTNDKAVFAVYPDGKVIEYRSICEANRLSKISLQTIYDSINNKPKQCKRRKNYPTWRLKEAIAA